MTSKNTFAADTRDAQDAIERHVHQEMRYEDGAGAIVKVKGNGTEDADVYVLRIGGLWLHLPKGMNADVFLLAGSADTNQKHALTDIPRDKHRKTKAGTTGIQHPTDPDISVELSDKGVRVTGENFAVGKDGAFEVKDGQIYARVPIRAGKIVADEIVTQSFQGPVPTAPPAENQPIPAIVPVQDAADVPSS